MNLSSLQSADCISSFFGKISQNFSPISLDNLLPNVKQFLTLSGPTLSEYQVAQKLKMAKKPNSQVKGDIPPKLMKLFYAELATPATMIFNSIIKHQEYPEKWKIEYGIPIPKSNPPK